MILTIAIIVIAFLFLIIISLCFVASESDAEFEEIVKDIENYIEYHKHDRDFYD